MSNNKDNGSLNEQKIASFLKDAVQKVEGASNAQIEELKQIAKIFKKNVPFSRRSYVLAHLVKGASVGTKGERSGRGEHSFKAERGEHSMRSDRRERGDRGDRFDRAERTERADRFERGERTAREDRRDVPLERGADERRGRAAHILLDPALSGTIFVGIGKTRSVSTRDIVGLLVGVAGLEKDRIGKIRVLPNYSFVQLYSEDCQKAIDALNGHEYRGLTLSVSFSRKKDDVEKDSPTQPSSVTKESDVETVPPKPEQTVDEPLEPQADDAPSPTPDSTSDQVDSSDEGTPESQAQPQNEAESFETDDDGQVRSHFGDGAAY